MIERLPARLPQISAKLFSASVARGSLFLGHFVRRISESMERRSTRGHPSATPRLIENIAKPGNCLPSRATT